MNIDLEMLKAQVEALRISYFANLPAIYTDDEDRCWLNKFFLWQTERENLAILAEQVPETSPERARIDRRRFQLQVLMDVAYIQGGLEGFDILRRIDPHSLDLAWRVYSQTDGSEELMVQEIEKIHK